ncbi:hypothetical protein SUGI_0462250 [Cryptomeria japonica]|nr:hypothetical protein SUGI_0462250 [Cryptomeria japonica]
MSVSYPFWINNSSSGYPGFDITCEKDKVTGMLAPFFYVNVGNYTDGKLKGNFKGGFLYPYKIMEICYTGYLVIDSYYNYAWMCENVFGTTYFDLPSDGPFTNSNSNTSGTYSFGGLGEVICVAICDPLEDDHEFLNEITILSQINHRNIMKLLGCCIQTKFPLLASEFVPNGTLFEHLHSKERFLSWASRLQIAIETAEALTYLHSGASQPIFHRDVKSSNSLLNERLSPKLEDFGICRLISASNNTHLTTNNIMGTRGYLDPEYFQTYQLTDKSDVYSFGVVLVELLTSLQPICTERASNGWSLSSLFLPNFMTTGSQKSWIEKYWRRETCYRWKIWEG